MTTYRPETGGRASAHRLLLPIAIMLFVIHAEAPGRTEPATGPAEVMVSERHGVYNLSAKFRVSQPPAVVLAVLTDYDQIPRFLPDVRTSVVRERLPGGVIVVEQEAVARVMLFSRRIYLLLEVQAEADAVHFRDSSGRSFSTYEGAWRLTEEGGQTAIAYELRARPSFDLPEFLLKRLLKRDALRMIDSLRAEIGARSR
jgi:carbon monoxide dehydrogenase subunit G